MKAPQIACLLCMMAVPATAQNQFDYTINGSTITVTGYFGSGKTVTIPDTIAGLPVTSIGGEGYFFQSITSVIIPGSVTNIGNSAFAHCTSLTNATIPNSVVNVGSGAFSYCTNLAGATLPDSVSSIGDHAFYVCSSLTSVTIPHGVTNIGYFAFAFCSGLTSVTMPDNVIGIAGATFVGCSGLTNAVISNGPAGVAPFMFQECTSLRSVRIPDSVTNIGSHAFFDCRSLTSVTIPGSVTDIGDFAFGDCVSLTGIYFNGNAPSTGSTVFYDDNNLNNTTVYYLPGTTNWDATFGGRPTVLWNPEPQTSDGCFGIQGDRFGFNITGTANIPIAVEACADQADTTWILLKTCSITNGSIYFSDPQCTNYPTRFYRLRSP